MKLNLIINTNVKLKEDFSHIPVEYGYSNYSNKLNNYTLKNSIMTKGFSTLDKLFNSLYPIKENDKRVINQVVETAKFLDNNLPEDLISKLKIQINVNSYLNEKFFKLGTAFLRKTSPMIRGIASNICYMYPNTQQVVIGTKAYDLNRDIGEGIVISSYLQIKKNSVEHAVDFTVLHECSHVLEEYNEKKYGNITNKVSDLYNILTYFETNIDNQNINGVISITAEEYNINNDFILDLKTLFSEIYADCGAVLLKHNSDIINGTYDKEQYEKYIDNLIDIRKMEATILDKIEKLQINHHDTSLGLMHLKNNDLIYDTEAISQEQMYFLCKESVNFGILSTLKEIVKNENHKNSINLLLNMKIENNEIKLNNNNITIEDFLNNSNKVKKINMV